MGTKIRGVIPAKGQSFSPTSSDMLDKAAQYNVRGTPASPHTRGSFGHGKATRLYWSEAAGRWVRLRVKNARRGGNTVAYTK